MRFSIQNLFYKHFPAVWLIRSRFESILIENFSMIVLICSALKSVKSRILLNRQAFNSFELLGSSEAVLTKLRVS